MATSSIYLYSDNFQTNKKLTTESHSPTESHTPLTLTCYNSNLNHFKYLLDDGADPNKPNADGLAPLHYCCMKHSSYPILLYLLEHPRFNININVGSEQDGSTPLMKACEAGLYKTVKILLDNGAEVNAEDMCGQSAIFYAVKGGFFGIIKLLISHNACVYLRDNENANILHCLLASPEILETRIVEQILVYLVEENGLDINTRMKNGETPLHKAVTFGLTFAIEYLIEKGANIEAKKNFLETPLWTCMKSLISNKLEVIKMLFNYGANFHARLGIMDLMTYSTKYLEDEEVTGTIEEILKILRRRRMNEMRAKRKAILFNIGNTSPIIHFSSPPHSPSSQPDVGDPPELYYQNSQKSNERKDKVRSFKKSSSSDSATSDSDADSDSSSLSSTNSTISSDELTIDADNDGPVESEEEGECRSSESEDDPEISIMNEIKIHQNRDEIVKTRQQRKRKGEKIIKGDEIVIIKQESLTESSEDIDDEDEAILISSKTRCARVVNEKDDNCRSEISSAGLKPGMSLRSRKCQRRNAVDDDIGIRTAKRVKRRTSIVNISDSDST